jgi:hypothetical protein
MTKVKFTEIKKRKIYKTWFHKNRRIGLISYIFHLPNGDYHFYISCFKKRCGLEKCIKDDCNMYVSYNSLNYGLQYDSFEKCRQAVIQWHKDRE